MRIRWNLFKKMMSTECPFRERPVLCPYQATKITDQSVSGLCYVEGCLPNSDHHKGIPKKMAEALVIDADAVSRLYEIFSFGEVQIVEPEQMTKWCLMLFVESLLAMDNFLGKSLGVLYLQVCSKLQGKNKDDMLARRNSATFKNQIEMTYWLFRESQHFLQLQTMVRVAAIDGSHRLFCAALFCSGMTASSSGEYIQDGSTTPQHFNDFWKLLACQLNCVITLPKRQDDTAFVQHSYIDNGYLACCKALSMHHQHRDIKAKPTCVADILRTVAHSLYVMGPAPEYRLGLTILNTKNGIKEWTKKLVGTVWTILARMKLLEDKCNSIKGPASLGSIFKQAYDHYRAKRNNPGDKRFFCCVLYLLESYTYDSASASALAESIKSTRAIENMDFLGQNTLNDNDSLLWAAFEIQVNYLWPSKAIVSAILNSGDVNEARFVIGCEKRDPAERATIAKTAHKKESSPPECLWFRHCVELNVTRSIMAVYTHIGVSCDKYCALSEILKWSTTSGDAQESQQASSLLAKMTVPTPRVDSQDNENPIEENSITDTTWKLKCGSMNVHVVFHVVAKLVEEKRLVVSVPLEPMTSFTDKGKEKLREYHQEVSIPDSFKPAFSWNEDLKNVPENEKKEYNLGDLVSLLLEQLLGDDLEGLYWNFNSEARSDIEGETTKGEAHKYNNALLPGTTSPSPDASNLHTTQAEGSTTAGSAAPVVAVGADANVDGADAAIVVGPGDGAEASLDDNDDDFSAAVDDDDAAPTATAAPTNTAAGTVVAGGADANVDGADGAIVESPGDNDNDIDDDAADDDDDAATASTAAPSTTAVGTDDDSAASTHTPVHTHADAASATAEGPETATSLVRRSARVQTPTNHFAPSSPAQVVAISKSTTSVGKNRRKKIQTASFMPAPSQDCQATQSDSSSGHCSGQQNFRSSEPGGNDVLVNDNPFLILWSGPETIANDTAPMDICASTNNFYANDAEQVTRNLYSSERTVGPVTAPFAELLVKPNDKDGQAKSKAFQILVQAIDERQLSPETLNMRFEELKEEMTKILAVENNDQDDPSYASQVMEQLSKMMKNSKTNQSRKRKRVVVGQGRQPNQQRRILPTRKNAAGLKRY